MRLTRPDHSDNLHDGNQNRHVDMNKWFKDWTPLPPDIVAWLSLPLMLALAVLTSSLLWTVLRGGVLSLFLAAVAAGVLGIALLFFARLPLYRRGQFLSFGPRELDARHRKLYRRAYVLIAVSVITMLTMLVVLR